MFEVIVAPEAHVAKTPNFELPDLSAVRRLGAEAFQRDPHETTPGEWYWHARLDVLEIDVTGGAELPDLELVAAASSAVERLEYLTRYAAGHLDAFVDREKLGGGPWYCYALNVLRDQARGHRLELNMSLTSDHDGYWTVVFHPSFRSDGYHASSFSRESL
jgi:hypothetical protein